MSGDTLTAVANPDGSVDVWVNANYVGHSGTSTYTGTGRIGIQLVSGFGNANRARIDNFRGGTVP